MTLLQLEAEILPAPHSEGDIIFPSQRFIIPQQRFYSLSAFLGSRNMIWENTQIKTKFMDFFFNISTYNNFNSNL